VANERGEAVVMKITALEKEKDKIWLENQSKEGETPVYIFFLLKKK